MFGEYQIPQFRRHVRCIKKGRFKFGKKQDNNKEFKFKQNVCLNLRITWEIN